MIYYGIALLVIVIDQLTKLQVIKTMDIGDKIELIPGYLSIYSHRNSGAAWGMLEGKMTFFYIITLFVVAGLIYYFQKEAKHKVVEGIAIMLILGGAIGNFIDRVLYQEVVDFISVWIPVMDYDFPIFNIADAALTIGVILLIVQMLIDVKKEKQKVEQ